MTLFDTGVEVVITGDELKQRVREVYEALAAAKLISLSVDKIAYTEDFERLYERIRSMYPLTRNEVFVLLMARRKSGSCHAPNGRVLKKQVTNKP